VPIHVATPMVSDSENKDLHLHSQLILSGQPGWGNACI
jgi:hypothetical protein